MTTYRRESSQLDTTPVYALVDALGIPLRTVSGANTLCGVGLEGEAARRYTVPSLGIKLEYQLSVIATQWQGLATTPVGVLLQGPGDLELFLLNDHKRDRLELFVLDGQKTGPLKKGIHKAWSRNYFMREVQPATATHYLLEGSEWVETPNARQWVKDYLEARFQHIDACEALALADALAHGVLKREDGLYDNWLKSTKAKKREKLADSPSAYLIG